MGSSAEHSALVLACLEELALMGFAAWPNRVGAAWIDDRFIKFGKKGSGDIAVLLPRSFDGQVVAVHGEIECKTGKAVQRKSQKSHMKVVRSNGGVYLIVRARHEVPDVLRGAGYSPRNSSYRPLPCPPKLL